MRPPDKPNDELYVILYSEEIWAIYIDRLFSQDNLANNITVICRSIYEFVVSSLLTSILTASVLILRYKDRPNSHIRSAAMW